MLTLWTVWLWFSRECLSVIIVKASLSHSSFPWCFIIFRLLFQSNMLQKRFWNHQLLFLWFSHILLTDIHFQIFWTNYDPTNRCTWTATMSINRCWPIIQILFGSSCCVVCFLKCGFCHNHWNILGQHISDNILIDVLHLICLLLQWLLMHWILLLYAMWFPLFHIRILSSFCRIIRSIFLKELLKIVHFCFLVLVCMHILLYSWCLSSETNIRVNVSYVQIL